MAARAIWKGVLDLGGPRVPVKLYSAVEDRGIGFRLLNPDTGRPIKQRLVDPDTGEEVPRDEIRRGYETEDGTFVVLDDDEMEALEPEASRTIELTRFLEPRDLPAPWYDRPYWLGPDGDEEGYAALAEALEREGREGVAHWVMRKKEYSGALRAEEGRLLLVTLRRAGEVIPASALPRPAGRDPEPKEREMAEQLVSALAGDFDPAEFRDEYRDRVLELIEAKAEGRTVELREYREEPEPEEPEDLSGVLEESVRAARGEAA